MTESGNHANGNGHGPFRRYSPPSTQNGSAATGGQDIRFSSSMPPSNSAANRSGSAHTRANRSARRRWRQWIQPQTPVSPQGAPSHSPTPGPSSGPKPTVQPIPRPSPIVTGNPQPPAALRKDNAAYRPQAQPPQPPVNRQPPTHKVTPLRQRPVWSTPADVGTAPIPQAPGNRRPPTRRRPTRNTPRPVLNGVRLLICGIGLAAIAGTLLSVLNPEQQETPPAPVVRRGDAPLTAGTPPNQRRGEAVTAPLPLTDKLTYLENTLLELESLAPGLSQATFALDLDTGNYVEINGAGAVAAASTIKLPILVAFLNAVDAGQITLEQGIVLREDLIVGGSGDMQVAELGTRYTALEVATQMMTQSDNTATQMMIELLGGNQAINQQFQDWGITSTVLRNALPDLEGTNTTSAQDLVRILALVEQGELLSLRSRDRLLGIMQRTYSRDLIPGGLGDEEALVFNKTGDIGTVLGDVALVDAPNGKRYILATLIERPHNDGRASELIRRIAELIHGEMNQPLAPVGGAVPEPSLENTPADIPGTSPEASPNGTGTEIPQG
ncbi:MAG: serine hydrolase [Leptolyngbyaceae cyanobacterium]